MPPMNAMQYASSSSTEQQVYNYVILFSWAQSDSTSCLVVAVWWLVVVLLVGLEERHQVRELEHEFVVAELELESWDLDELLLLSLVVAVLVG